jgi:cell division protein FtsB
MVTAESYSHSVPEPNRNFSISYTQSDVDMIRQQVEEYESAKRRWLLLALVIMVVGLVATIALLSTSYALYSASESKSEKLASENAALRSGSDQIQQQLDTRQGQEANEALAREDAKTSMDELIPLVLGSKASGGNIARLAQMIYKLPGSRIEFTQKPPDHLFRNWKVATESGTEVYTLVGGFFDGKWVIYSNLVARRKDEG